MEATCALDNATEQLAMSAIDKLSTNLTILIIAHRITTIKSCDVIVDLERGRVVVLGIYAKLLKSSTSFDRMAALDQVRR